MIDDPARDAGQGRRAREAERLVRDKAKRGQTMRVLGDGREEAGKRRRGAVEAGREMIYNRGSRPADREAVELIIDSQWAATRDDRIVAGDFNLHHPAWAGEETRAESQPARDLVNWADAHGLSLASEPGVITRRGNEDHFQSTIDLVWASTDLVGHGRLSEVSASFDDSLGSDHAALSWDWTPTRAEASDTSLDPKVDGYITDPAKKKEWSESCALLLDRVTPPDGTAWSPAALETEAGALIDAMTGASHDTFKPRRHARGEAQKWWNPECTDAVEKVQGADRGPSKTAASRTLKGAIRRAKRAWADKVTSEASANDIWGLVAWGTGTARKATLGRIRKPDGTFATTPADKADVLFEAYFPSDRPTVDAVQPDDPPARPTRDFPAFTTEELREALQPTSNKSAPGQDGNSYRLLKWMAAIAEGRLLDFCNGCVSAGHSPERLSPSVDVVIGKPGKKDKEDPKSSRTIALRMTLAKLVEKMVNNRMQHDAAALDLLPPNQFGCRQKSSTLDAGQSLTHDIEVAWSRKWSASLITFDISGFFDRVDHDRMCHTLELMGFAPTLVAWVRSWLAGRSVAFLIDGVRVPPRPCPVGVPQGSPLSPILSALYTAFVVGSPLDDPHAFLPFYVDDGAILALGPDLEDNVKRGEVIYEDKAKRLWRIGLPCPPSKIESMHFTRRHNMGSPAFRLWTPSGTPHHCAPRDVIRWLGFFLDRKLTYKRHVEIRCNRASSALQALHVLGNSVRGLEAWHFRQLINACVITKATYGAPLWFGKGAGKTAGLVKKLQAVQDRGCRLLLGAFRTSPLKVCGYLAALPPMSIRLERMCVRAAIRLRTIPASAPPVRRAQRMWTGKSDPDLPVQSNKRPRTEAGRARARGPLSRLEAWAAKAGVTSKLDETIVPFTTAPWERHLSQRHGTRYRTGGLGMKKKDRAVEVKSETKALDLDAAALVAWTDGSRRKVQTHVIGPGAPSVAMRVGGARVIGLGRPRRGHVRITTVDQARTGAGYAVTRGGKTHHTARLGLGAMADNYDGELAALAAAASYAAARSNADPTITRWIFYSDNASAVQSIGDRGDRPGQQYARIFGSKVDEFLAGCDERKVEVRWTPSHVGVPGNELADDLAKQAVKLPAISGFTITWAKAESTRQAAAVWKKDWKSWRRADAWWAPATRKAPKLKPSHFLKTPGSDRAGACRAFQAVLGHAMTGEYYARFVPAESPRCRCGLPFESNLHALLFCPASETSRRAAFAKFKIDPSRRTHKGVLGTMAGLRAIAQLRPAFSKSERLPPPALDMDDGG
jgi:ribonuclease HI